MIWTLKDLIKHCSQTTTKTSSGQWVPARPLPGPWLWRIQSAWEVLCGRADAFIWPDNQ